MAFSELHSQIEVIFYDDDHLLPCDRTKTMGMGDMQCGELYSGAGRVVERKEPGNFVFHY